MANLDRFHRWTHAARAGRSATRVALVAPTQLRRCVALQRTSAAAFGGWITPHPARWWEYPWAMGVLNATGPGAILDAGAGTSPLPLALKQQGNDVMVVDLDSEGATGRTCGGEWVYTDYGGWGIPTFNQSMDQPVSPAGSLDAVVSISVIEHVPARVRRASLQCFESMLKPGGRCVFTVDVVRGTRHLWNQILGAQVEEPRHHGTLDDLHREARHLGLYLTQEVCCPISTHRHDIVGLIYRKEP